MVSGRYLAYVLLGPYAIRFVLASMLKHAGLLPLCTANVDVVLCVSVVHCP